MPDQCSECGAEIAQVPKGRTRLTCKTACKSRRRRRLFRERAIDLVRRQSAAIRAGDAAALAQVDRDAAALFGVPFPPRR